MTNQWSRSIEQRFVRLLDEVSRQAACFLLLHDDEGKIRNQWIKSLESIGAQSALRLFSLDGLPKQLGYPYLNGLFKPGSVHFPLLDLSRSTRYKHYWVIESDVEYRGNWGTFLSAYGECEASLIGSHIRRHLDCPAWYWWNSLTSPSRIRLAVEDLRKAFLPIYRISASALDVVDEAHKRGFRGHFEVLIPTMLHLNGMSIEDIRNITECYLGDIQDPCWSRTRLSTLRWRPEIPLGEFMNRGTGPLLFHPVKQDWAFDGSKVVRWRKR